MQRVKFGLTKLISLGEYENIRIEYSLEEQCTEADKADTIARMTAEVRAKINAEEASWKV